MNDLLNVDLVNDNLKKFDQSRKETPMALWKGPEGVLLEGLYRRHMEKSTRMQTALAQCHSDRVHRKEPKSYSRLMVSDVLEDQQQNSLTAHKEKGRVKEGAIPVAPGRMKVTGNEEIANRAHQQAPAQEAQNVRSSTMTRVEEREKETSDWGRQVQRKDNPLRNQKPVTGQAQGRQETESRPLSFSHKKGSCLKHKHCDHRHPQIRAFQKEDSVEQISATMIAHRVPHVSKHHTKGFEHHRENTKQKDTLCSFPTWINSTDVIGVRGPRSCVSHARTEGAGGTFALQSHHANFRTCAISSIDFLIDSNLQVKNLLQNSPKDFKNSCSNFAANSPNITTTHVANMLRLSSCPSKHCSTCAADSKRAANLNFQTCRTSSNSFWHTQQFLRWKRREVLLAK